jgi:putative hydrolase of the HAD superfamily
MIIMLPQCIVFDLDNPLYLERDYVGSGLRALGGGAQTALGVPDCADRTWRLFEAGERRRTFRTVWAEPQQKPEPDMAAHLTDICVCHSPEIELFPDRGHSGSERKREASLGIVTDRPPRVRMPIARVSAISSPELKLRNSGLFRGL